MRPVRESRCALDTITWPLPNLGHLARAGFALISHGEATRCGGRHFAPVGPTLLSNLVRDAYWPGVVWAVSAVSHLLGDRERAAALYLGVHPFSRLSPGRSGAFLGCTDHHLGLLAETSGRPVDAAALR